MSFLFDGSNQTLTHDLSTGIDAWPITILVKFKDAEGTSTENDRCIVDFTDTTGVFPFFRAGRNDSDQKLRLAVRHSNNAPATAKSTGTYSADVWNTGAWEVVDGSNGFSRLNGSSRGPNLSGSIPGSFAANGPFERISIGYERNSSTDPWDGKLAEIAIYTSILTDAQHTAFHNGDKPDTIDAGNLEMYLSLATDSLTDSINSYVFTAEGTVDPVFDNDHPSMNGGSTTTPKSTTYNATGTASLAIVTTFKIQPNVTATGTPSLVKLISKFFGMSAIGSSVIQKTTSKSFNMTAILTNANSSTTPGSTAGSGDMQVLVSGVFGGATARIELEADSLNKAVVAQFLKDGGIVVTAKTGTTITGSVIGGDDTTSIDISVL